MPQLFLYLHLSNTFFPAPYLILNSGSYLLSKEGVWLSDLGRGVRAPVLSVKMYWIWPRSSLRLEVLNGAFLDNLHWGGGEAPAGKKTVEWTDRP